MPTKGFRLSGLCSWPTRSTSEPGDEAPPGTGLELVTAWAAPAPTGTSARTAASVTQRRTRRVELNDMRGSLGRATRRAPRGAAEKKKRWVVVAHRVRKRFTCQAALGRRGR